MVQGRGRRGRRDAAATAGWPPSEPLPNPRPAHPPPPPSCTPFPYAANCSSCGALGPSAAANFAGKADGAKAWRVVGSNASYFVFHGCDGAGLQAGVGRWGGVGGRGCVCDVQCGVEVEGGREGRPEGGRAGGRAGGRPGRAGAHSTIPPPTNLPSLPSRSTARATCFSPNSLGPPAPRPCHVPRPASTRHPRAARTAPGSGASTRRTEGGVGGWLGAGQGQGGGRGVPSPSPADTTSECAPHVHTKP